MKPQPIGGTLFGVLLLALLSGCGLGPKKAYPGPDLPMKDLAFVMQIEDLLYRPIYMISRENGGEEIAVDDLGVIMLPGVYRFKAKLYRSRLQEVPRLATMTVVPGESDFPVQQPVLRWERADEPYKETEMTPFDVKAGLKYGLWCADDEQIHIKVLGSYP